MTAVIVEQGTSPPLLISYRTGATTEEVGNAAFSEPVQMVCSAGVCEYEPPVDAIGALLDVKLTLKMDTEGTSVTIDKITAAGKKKATTAP